MNRHERASLSAAHFERAKVSRGPMRAWSDESTIAVGDLTHPKIGVALEPAFIARLAQVTVGTAQLRSLAETTCDELCDILVLDPRRLTSSSPESLALRRHVEAHVPCVYYTASNQQALRLVLAASEVTPVRLVLFDVDDDPITIREVIGLAPRLAHTNRLRSAMKTALQPLPPSVRVTLDTVIRRPEQFFDAGDVALRAGLSRRHLDRLLTAADLAPVKNWVVGARAWHAAHLLVCGRYSVAATASRLGYADSKALRRHLSAVWSVSPTMLSCGDADTTLLLGEMVTFLRTRESDAEIGAASSASNGANADDPETAG
jgi:AraC-like DNA-binding protein